MKKACTFEEAITMTGFGLYNWYLIFVSGGFIMCVIIETMNMMFIVPAAQCDLNLSLSEKGILSSTCFLGIVASSHLWGFIADTRGRRNALMLSLFSSFIISIICSLISMSWLLILLRFLGGFCVGGANSIIYVYAGEFHNNSYRPRIISWIVAFVALGNIFLPGLAWIILPQQWSYDIQILDITFKPWRLLYILYTLPSLLFTACLSILPESPKYLLAQGKYDEALYILKKMYKINTRNSEDDYPVSKVLLDDLDNMKSANKKGLLNTIWQQTSPLFRKPFLVKTILVCLLEFGIFATTSGMTMWYPEILNKMSYYVTNHNGSVTMCNSMYFERLTSNFTEEISPNGLCNDTVNTKAFSVPLFVGIVYTVVYIVIGTVINMVGKKKLLGSFVVVCTIAGIAAGHSDGYMLIQILLGIFIIGAAEIGILHAIIVDLYPTQIRAMALAVALMFGRLGAMTGTNIIGPLLYTLCEYLFYIYAVDHIILLIVLVMLPSPVVQPPKIIEVLS